MAAGRAITAAAAAVTQRCIQARQSPERCWLYPVAAAVAEILITMVSMAARVAQAAAAAHPATSNLVPQVLRARIPPAAAVGRILQAGQGEPGLLRLEPWEAA